MSSITRVWGFGLLIAAAVPFGGCQENEVTRIIPINAGGDGGNGGGGDASMDGGRGASAPDGRDGGVIEDSASAHETGDASDGPAEAAPDLPAPGSPDAGEDRGQVVPTPIPNAYAGKPWNNSPHVIPGVIQCELYDTGGELVAFHDTEPLNRGSGELNLNINTPQAMFRRSEGVDISFTKAGADRYPNGMNLPVNDLYVGWVVPTEWLKYTVNVVETGNYMISAHTSANNEGSSVSFSFEDGTTTGPLPIPRTGSWNIWSHVDNMAIVHLTAGIHVLTIKSETQGNNNFDYVTFTRKP